MVSRQGQRSMKTAIKRFLVFGLIWFWRFNIPKFWFSKPFFHVENQLNLYKKNHWRIQKWEINFYFYHILIILIFNVLYFLKMRPNFDVRYQIGSTKSSQIARTFLWPFLLTFGLAYSPLNSATLSCSSEVTLTMVHVEIQTSM